MEDSGIDSDPKPAVNINRTNNERILMTNNIAVGSSHKMPQDRQRRCSTKQLQRKLEARIEQAKRIQRNNSEYIKVETNDYKTNSTSSKSIGLIPIQRLPIPHCSESMSHHEQYPLVEYWQSDSTESEDETTLFPLSRGNKDHSGKHKQDLTDTFSIQESSEGSEDSLNLIGPTAHHSSHSHTRTYVPTGCFNCSCRII
ncbi:hypothetical protein PV325_005478 [Microctonus aethiopoides]|nr:hypothetical protein PV325_005478 [Microctonus aethiopoides]KAK0090424.1 hypothetical protein PV326_004136 [Microctonus aethiopoides]